MWKADMRTVRDLARQFGEHIELLEQELTERGIDPDVWLKRYDTGVEQYEAIRDQATNLLSWIPSQESIGEEAFLSNPFFPSYHMVNTFLPRLIYASTHLRPFTVVGIQGPDGRGAGPGVRESLRGERLRHGGIGRASRCA